MIAMRSETSRSTNHSGTRRAEVMASSSSEDASSARAQLPEEIAPGDTVCFGGDFAQGSTLALADATQDIAQFAAQQRSFAQCLSISLL